MRTLYFFWYELNWLEFVTYILIPTSMILVILAYIYFNIEILKLTFNIEFEIFDKKLKRDIKDFKYEFHYDNNDENKDWKDQSLETDTLKDKELVSNLKIESKKNNK